MSESHQQNRRQDPSIPAHPLDELDKTDEITLAMEPDPSEAEALACDLRKSATKLLKLNSMSMMQQAAHAPVIMAEVCSQVAYAVELIELNKHG